MDLSRKKRWPAFGVACIAISILALVQPFVFGPNLGGRIDIGLRESVPVIVLLLAIMAFVFRERVIWPIIGLLLAAFYVGLHLIPCC
jgi:hypothetical protein